MNKRNLLSLVLLFVFIKCFSQTCCSGGIPLSNNLGLTNFGKGVFQVGLHYDFNYLNTLNFSTENLNDNSRQRITHSLLLNLGYEFTDKLSIETLFTWVNQRRTINQFNNTDLQTSKGFGDAVFLMKYELLEALGRSSKITLGIGPKIPIGSFNEKDNRGITYIADLQPGSGAWDIIFYTQFNKNFNFRPSLTFSGRGIFKATGKNNKYLESTQVYQYGNELQVYLGVLDQFILFNKLFDSGIQFKYRKANVDRIDTFNLDNTGGQWVFIVPSISINLSTNLIFETKFELPVHSNVEGTQLTPTYRLTAGLMINFNLKTNSQSFKNIEL